MDPVVFIPETRNTSSTDNATTFTEELGCTSLNGLDLADTFTGMDIGNTEFWGTVSDFWRPCFIIYCILFYTALLLLFCSCVGLLYCALKQAAYSLRTLVYLLTLYIIWSTFSLAHGILMINSFASSSSDRGLAHATIVLDTITSASFVCIILVAFYSSLESKIHFTLRYALLSTSVIYIEAIIIVVLSIPVGISVTSIFVCLIVLKSLMFVTSMVLLFIVIFFKHNSLSAKELICLLWKDNKILLIIAFPYFLLLYAYFLYISITVISNNDCTENIQLQREGWLVFNSLLRICEVSFSASYFARMFVRETCIAESISESDTDLPKTPGKPKLSVNIFHVFSESEKRPVGKSVTPSDLEEQKAHSYNKSLSYSTEIKHLAHDHTPNFDVEILSQSMSQSTVTDQLQSVDSDRFLDAANFSSTDTLNVEVINAHAPVDTEYLIGDIEVGMFDERGGVFHSYKHGVTVIFPAGAIPSGILAKLKFAATLVSSMPFQSNIVPLSAIFWLCMEVRLQKPIQLRLPLLKSENIAGALQFAKSSHSTKLNIIGDQMKGLEHGTFVDGESYGSIEVDHFCYYCITKNNLKQEDIPSNKYLLIAMKQSQPSSKDKSWSIHICLVPDLRTCDEHLKEQYNCDWEYKELTRFSFIDGCDELKIELLSNDFGNAAKIVLSDMKIKQEDVDFHQYYSNGKLEELRYRMDQKQYPPRCKAIVTAKHKDFYVKARKIIIQCTCNAKCSYKGKISIPCTSSEGYSSESDSNLPQPRQIKSSGYGSDENVDDFGDEEAEPGGLQLRNLIVLTSNIKGNWYNLGIDLKIPITKMENLYGKYYANPMKALNRVYCYWLSDKNGLSPTWEKLCSSLRKIKEFTIAADVEKFLQLPADEDDAVFNDDPNGQALKKRVMKYMRPDLLNLDTLMPYLNKYQLLTQDSMYDLKNPLVSPNKRANELVYHILPSKGPRGFILFVKCLQEETQHLGHQTLANLFTMPPQCDNTSHQDLSTLPSHIVITSKETFV